MATLLVIRCTGVTAMWCPLHGACTCHWPVAFGQEGPHDDPTCPLHAPDSPHPLARARTIAR
jgi:hypothetical protein